MSTIDAKVSALIAALPQDSPGADSASDKAAAAPPSGTSSGSESAAGAPDAASSPASPGSSPAAPTMADLFSEKLKEVRDRRKASVAGREARTRQAEAERLAAETRAEREAVAKERAELAEGRKDFRKFFEANGMSAQDAYEEMTRQAVEAGTPEAQRKADQAAWRAEMAQTVEPLKKTIEQLTKERDDAQRDAQERSFANDFATDVKADAYRELRIEYDDARLLEHAKRFRDEPKFFYRVAEEHAVALTDPSKGFSMVDILNVLQSVQDAHRKGTESRRAALAAPSEAAEQPATSPTVNGTAARANAGQTIGNDLTTARAADGKFVPRGATAAQRVRERTRRLAGG